MSMRKLLTVSLVAVALMAGGAQAELVDVAVNGSFETGDFEGWTLFPSGEDQFSIVMPGTDGDNAALISNTVVGSAALMKNANVGIGVVEPGQMVTISFDARGALAAGGVAFAEFFSELEGGGTSASEILGGAPLALDADPEVWTNFQFETMTGPDVSGGVTLQLTATTGADPASSAMVYYDNISIVVESTVATEATTWTEIKTLYR